MSTTTNPKLTLSGVRQETLNNVVNDLTQTENVVAVVLGGSFAVGKATSTSDLDIGIYYSNKNPFDIGDIKSIANKYAIADPTVTGFYEWGPWVNGGAWIETASGKVDFLYRNIEQVTSTIEAAKREDWENHFEHSRLMVLRLLFILRKPISAFPFMILAISLAN